MTNRHSPSAEKKRKERPSPSTSAAELPINTKLAGNDGNEYEVRPDSRGVKRWFKVKSDSAPRPSKSPKRKSPKKAKSPKRKSANKAKSPKRKSSPKKAKSPKRKSANKAKSPKRKSSPKKAKSPKRKSSPKKIVKVRVPVGWSSFKSYKNSRAFAEKYLLKKGAGRRKFVEA